MTLTSPVEQDYLSDEPTVTLAQIIRRLDGEHPDYTDQELCTLAIEEMRDESDPLRIARPAIVDYTCTVRRSKVRSHEKSLAGLWNPADDPLKSRREAAGNFRTWATLYANDFLSVNGTKVRVGDMTVDDWQQRIAELSAQIAADSESVARAEVVVERLRKARKSTLDSYLAR